MKISILDFPFKKENNIIYKKDGNILIDLNNSSKEELLELINIIFPSLNYGKNKYMIRKTYSYKENMKDAFDIATWQWLNKGWKFCKKGEQEMEITIYSIKQNSYSKEKRIAYLKRDNHDK